MAAKIKFFSLYSTLQGYTAFRNKIYGSFFIQIFCQTLEHYGHCLHLQEILRKTRSDVTRICPQQVPIVEDCLPLNIFLTKKKE